MLDKQEFIKTAELSSTFGVSEVSIRKDLDYLELRGLVKRVHGGATLSKNSSGILFLAERYVENRRAKQAIAAAAAKRLQGMNLRIYLDTGTTVLELARCIPEGQSILLYTNSLTTISALEGRDDVQVVSLGGTVDYRSKSTHGPVTDSQIDRLRFDVCFLGAESITASAFGCSDVETALYLRRVVANSEESYVLADSSKVRRRASAVYAVPGEVSTFVTDGRIPDDVAEALFAGGTRLIRAGEVDTGSADG